MRASCKPSVHYGPVGCRRHLQRSPFEAAVPRTWHFWGEMGNKELDEWAVCETWVAWATWGARAAWARSGRQPEHGRSPVTREAPTSTLSLAQSEKAQRQVGAGHQAWSVLIPAGLRPAPSPPALSVVVDGHSTFSPTITLFELFCGSLSLFTRPFSNL